MRLQGILLFGCAGIAVALPNTWARAAAAEEPAWIKGFKWIPASKIDGAKRSPCPILNSLANHGFLARNGRNITTDDLNKAQVAALNMEPSFAADVTNIMIGKLGLTPPSDGRPIIISLDALNAHGATEHDASLTRLDAKQGDAVAVQPDLVQKLLDDTVPQNAKTINAQSLARTRLRREKESIAAGSPGLGAGDKEGAIFEAASFLFITGQPGSSPATWSLKKEVAKELFVNERFATDIGYVRSVTPSDGGKHGTIGRRGQEDVQPGVIGRYGWR